MVLVSERFARIDSVPPGQYVPTADHRVVMTGLTWQGFESFLAVRGEKGPRVTYLEGVLELMSPSKTHESIKTKLAAVVEVYLDHLGVEYDGLGAWLLKNAPQEAGLEPDECYIIGELDKPRPDLAIEVVWTSGGIDKLEVYRRLGVNEVWFWSDAVIRFYVLVNDVYVERDTSVCVPTFDRELAYQILELPSLSAVRRALRERFG
jgi:Uma2 family endonuclease